MSIEPSVIARTQFAFTVSFHIIFPTISIGLASFLAIVEGLWLKTKGSSGAHDCRLKGRMNGYRPVVVSRDLPCGKPVASK